MDATPNTDQKQPTKAQRIAETFKALAFSPSLSHGAVRLYQCLYYHLNWKTGKCCPSRRRIEELMRCNNRSVARWRAELIKERWIAVHPRIRGQAMHYALYDATGTSLGPVAILPPLEESKAVAHVPPVESIGSENSGGTLTESGGHMTPEVVAVLPKVVAILPPEPNSEPIREHNSERKGGPIESMGNNHSPKIIRKMVGAEIIEYEREDFEVPGLEQVLDFDATLEDKTDVADSNHAEYWWEAKEKTQWMAGGKRIRDWRATYLGFLLKVDGDRCGVMA